MSTSRFIAATVISGMMVMRATIVCSQVPTAAPGQDFPACTIRIVTGGVGGGGDFISRLIAQGISGPFGQQVIVDNRGGGTLQAEIVSKAPPDGYTLVVQGSSLWIGPLLRKTTFDPIADFAPVTLTTKALNLVVVHPSVPVKSVRELIALAKARPGELNYASAGTGGLSHLSAELFKHMAGVHILRINYKGQGAALNDLLSGRVQLTFEELTVVTPHVKSDKLRALAVTSAQPSALAPGLPTVAASGLPGYESVGPSGVFAPAKTPEPIIQRLNQEIVRVLRGADAKEKFFNIGVEVVGSSPEELAAAMRSEMATLGKVIKDAGIKGE